MSITKMSDIDLFNKKVLIRTDLNVPIKEGKIQSDARIIAALPSIKKAISYGAHVIIASHLGRPIEGIYDNKFSLKPVVESLKKYLHTENIVLIKDYLNGFNVNKKNIVVLENVRFNIGETQNTDSLSKKYANLCDVFVMDAFATAHRKHASTYGICNFVSIVCAGELLISELNSLEKILKNPKKPMIAVLGGSKVSTKFHILKFLTKITDKILVGGGMANTFFAINNKVGNSLYEPSFIKAAKKLYDTKKIIIPIDVRVGNVFSENASSKVKNIFEINKYDIIMDIGNKTILLFSKILHSAKTILWNGPMGIFEFKNFKKGTESIANVIANSHAFSVAGGGDTISVIDLFNLKEKISYISTAGGAFLEFIEGKSLPCIKIIKNKKV